MALQNGDHKRAYRRAKTGDWSGVRDISGDSVAEVQAALYYVSVDTKEENRLGIRHIP